MSVLSDIVEKFRKGSPNIAAAFDEVERRLILLERPEPPPPAPDFGASIPAGIPVSTGTQYYVSPSGSNANSGAIGSPWLTIQHALNTVGTTGSIINLRGGTHTADAGDITWSRAGSASNPVTVRGYPGETAILDGSRILITGSYLRLEDFETRNSGSDGIKFDSGSHHLYLDGLTIRDTVMQGILIGGGGVASSDFQIWNTRIISPGNHVSSDDQHGIYFSATAGINVVANCLIYAYDGYGLHWYSSYADAGATTHILNCTCDETLGEDGGPVTFATTGIDVRLRGCVLTDSVGGYEAIRMWNTVDSAAVVADCVAYDVTAPSFPTTTVGGAAWGGTYTNNTTADPLYVSKASRDYHLRAGSPAIDRCSARPEWVPAQDIDGTYRVTADAGCFAKT